MATSAHHRRLQGTVVSNTMDKTIVVKIVRSKAYSKYHKQYTMDKKFKVHDPDNAYQVGDIVVIEETRPMSKEKRWRVIEKISS